MVIKYYAFTEMWAFTQHQTKTNSMQAYSLWIKVVRTTAPRLPTVVSHFLGTPRRSDNDLKWRQMLYSVTNGLPYYGDKYIKTLI